MARKDEFVKWMLNGTKHTASEITLKAYDCDLEVGTKYINNEKRVMVKASKNDKFQFAEDFVFNHVTNITTMARKSMLRLAKFDTSKLLSIAEESLGDHFPSEPVASEVDAKVKFDVKRELRENQIKVFNDYMGKGVSFIHKHNLQGEGSALVRYKMLLLAMRQLDLLNSDNLAFLQDEIRDVAKELD